MTTLTWSFKVLLLEVVVVVKECDKSDWPCVEELSWFDKVEKESKEDCTEKRGDSKMLGLLEIELFRVTSKSSHLLMNLVLSMGFEQSLILVEPSWNPIDNNPCCWFCWRLFEQTFWLLLRISSCCIVWIGCCWFKTLGNKSINRLWGSKGKELVICSGIG